VLPVALAALPAALLRAGCFKAGKREEVVPTVVVPPP
jgi:hypothetical protein